MSSRRSSSQRDRKALPSSEFVHHIVKSEVSRVEAEVNANVSVRIDALEAGMTAMNAMLDKCISAIGELSRGRPVTCELK